MARDVLIHNQLNPVTRFLIVLKRKSSISFPLALDKQLPHFLPLLNSDQWQEMLRGPQKCNSRQLLHFSSAAKFKTVTTLLFRCSTDFGIMFAGHA